MTEISGVPAYIPSRSKVIEEALAKDGKTRADATTLEKQVISMATRPHKDERDHDLVKQYWVTKSRELGIDYGPQSRLDGREYGESGPASGAGRVPSDPNLPAGLTPAQAVVQYAINHLTEREQVVTQLDLLTVALQRSVGLAGPDQVRAEIARLVQQGTLIESAPAFG